MEKDGGIFRFSKEGVEFEILLQFNEFPIYLLGIVRLPCLTHSLESELHIYCYNKCNINELRPIS